MYHICCDLSIFTNSVYICIYDNLPHHCISIAPSFQKLKNLLFLRGYKITNGDLKIIGKKQLLDVVEITLLACENRNVVYTENGKNLIFQTSKEVLKYFQDK